MEEVVGIDVFEDCERTWSFLGARLVGPAAERAEAKSVAVAVDQVL